MLTLFAIPKAFAGPISPRYAVVAATDEVMMTHQNYTYTHCGIQGENYSLNEALKLDECKRYYDLLGGEFRRFGASDASHVLTATGECRRNIFVAI